MFNWWNKLQLKKLQKIQHKVTQLEQALKKLEIYESVVLTADHKNLLGYLSTEGDLITNLKLEDFEISEDNRVIKNAFDIMQSSWTDTLVIMVSFNELSGRETLSYSLKETIKDAHLLVNLINQDLQNRKMKYEKKRN